jgi:hypothetical protein
MSAKLEKAKIFHSLAEASILRPIQHVVRQS